MFIKIKFFFIKNNIFYINNLNKYTLEINPILEISKLTSIIIYNARLSTIGYFYYLEIKEDIDLDNNNYNIEDFINKYLNNNLRLNKFATEPNYFTSLLLRGILNRAYRK